MSIFVVIPADALILPVEFGGRIDFLESRLHLY